MRKTLLISLVFILSAACSKEQSRYGEEAVVHIRQSVSSCEEVTRAPIIGASFPDNSTYGIFVCKHGSTTTTHKSNSWNIKSLYTESFPGWNYYYVSNLSNGTVATAGYDHITLTAREDGYTADLYAYAPYLRAAYASNITSIPYIIDNEINNQIDLMYAEENINTYNDSTLGQDGNENLSPLSDSDLSASFTFRHAFSLIAFRFKLQNDSSTGGFGKSTDYHLSNISVSLNDPDADGVTTAKLYSSGTFNAINGSFNGDGVEESTLSVTYDTYYTIINSASSYLTAYMLIVPTQVENDELVFTFTVDDQILSPFFLKKAYVQHGDSSYGFRSGFMYTFNFTLDNYLFFDGFTVSSEWTAETLGSEEI